MPQTLTASEIAERDGFDISLIRASLSYTHEQRVIQHPAALELMLEMERAGRDLRDSTQQTHRETLRR